MLNLIQACVLGYNGNYTLEEVLSNCYDGEERIEDLEYYDIENYDYMNIGLYNADTKEVYFIDDNCHRDPNEWIRGFCKCLESLEIEYSLIKKVVECKDVFGG